MSETRKGEQNGLEPYQFKCPQCGKQSEILKEPTMKLLAELLKERDELRQRLRIAGVRIRKVEDGKEQS